MKNCYTIQKLSQISKKFPTSVAVREATQEYNYKTFFDMVINISNQINSAVKGLRKDKVNNLIFAYEPIWAIGTGEVASLVDAVEVLSMVKENISQKPFYHNEKVRFIYGGSVTPDNSAELLNTNIIDGALVGGASLDVDKFVKIINSVNL